MRFLINQRCIS